MRLVFDRRADVVEFVSERIRFPLYFDGVAFEAVGAEDESGYIKAGVIFHHYRPLLGGHDCEVNAAVDPGWHIRRDLLRDVFFFAFFHLRCVRLTALAPKAHKKSRKVACQLGFRQEGVHRWGYGLRKTAISYGMTFDGCKWLSDEDRALIAGNLKGSENGRIASQASISL